ncbi:MAG: pilus assembly protein [Candidatus Sericytochromatia bacterium]|nr:pilus assembly protein [Candidatus Sericytochromatia bacterium]
MKTPVLKLLQDEEGQGLVEFAVVLPILLLLTVGTILLTVSYIQKSRMNGLAYMAARATAVRRDSDFSTRETLTQYQTRSGQNWVSSVRVLPVPDTSERQVSVLLAKPGERLDLLANLVSGQPPADRPQDLQVRMSLNPEYPASGPRRPQTASEVDYRYQTRGELPWNKLPDFITGLLVDTTQMADPVSSDLAERDKALSLEPPNKSLKDFYKTINWGDQAYQNNSEKEAEGFARMQTIHDNFKQIESGGSILDLILSFVPFINQLKLVLGDIGEDAARQVEKSMGELSQELDSQVRRTFQNGGNPS